MACAGARGRVQRTEKEAMQKRKERHTEIGGHALLENGVRRAGEVQSCGPGPGAGAAVRLLAGLWAWLI